MDLTSFFNKLEVYFTEVANNNLTYKEEGSFSDWDTKMHTNWFKLIIPPMIYSKSNKIARKECTWEPPPTGWLKLNFYGASIGNSGPIGLGYIICSDNGSCLTKHAKILGVLSNNLVELEALIEGLT